MIECLFVHEIGLLAVFHMRGGKGMTQHLVTSHVTTGWETRLRPQAGKISNCGTIDHLEPRKARHEQYEVYLWFSPMRRLSQVAGKGLRV